MTVLYTTGFAIKYATAVAHKLSPLSGLELKDVLNYLALFFGYLAIYSLNKYLFISGFLGSEESLFFRSCIEEHNSKNA